MDSREKYEYWLNASRYDLDSAKVMLNCGRYMYVAFMCQQAIEKLVKGIHVLYIGEEASRIHNIVKVFNNIFMNREIMALIIDNEFDSKSEKYMDLFDELLYYYIAERYPNYKQEISMTVTEERANRILKESEEVFEWLIYLSQFKR